jgi:cation diffusion facilitator CzcD-associated flavoprotein CzcO
MEIDMKKSKIKVAVIGAGFSGILAGIKLREQGIDFEIFEKASTLGGTWRDNVYPGVACDVPSHLYVYSFAPNPRWSHRYADGSQIWRYLEKTAKKYRIFEKITFDTEIASAEWQGDRWKLTTSAGKLSFAEIVITAVGRLHHPSMPNLKGLDDFRGEICHSARWDTSFDERGKSIGIIGTGSSGVQIIAALSASASRLTIFQRTPHWVLSVPNPATPFLTKMAMRLPFVAKYYYKKLQRDFAKLTAGVGSGEDALIARAARKHLKRVRDPVLRAKVTPDYTPGCKRMVASPNYHEAIQRENVEIVTDAIERIVPEGIRTVTGRTVNLDAIVLATGFQAGAFLRPMKVVGADGVTLDAIWSDLDINYKTVALPHMPNFFMINGPYSPGGTIPIIAIAEIDVKYIMKCVEHIRRNDIAMAPSMDASRNWLNGVRNRASQTVWVTGGCQSWYLGKDGVPIVNPANLEELSEDLRAIELDDFVIFRKIESDRSREYA